MTTDGTSKTRRGAGRVAFHALRETIRGELEAGYTVRMIYERHQEAIPVSYEQLRAYIARDLTKTLGSRGGRLKRPSQRKPVG